MEIEKVLDSLKSAAGIVKALGPLAGPLGIVSTVASFAEAAIAIADNIQKRAKEGKIVLSSDNALEISQITERLRHENDNLAAYIRNS